MTRFLGKDIKEDPMTVELEVQLAPPEKHSLARHISTRVFAFHPAIGAGIERILSGEQDFRLVDNENQCEIGIFVWEAESLAGKLAIECSSNPDMRCLLFLPGPNQRASRHLRVSNVWGIVSHERDITEAARAIANGQLWVDLAHPRVEAKTISARVSLMRELTFREREILLLLGEHANKEIAYRLRISERTVKFHMSNILRKTQTSSRRELLGKLSVEAVDLSIFRN